MSITLEQVCYTYQEGTPLAHPALKQIDLTIEKGEFVGIMGRTGCGKTTLMQLAAGLLNPTSGLILLDGRDIHSRRFPMEELRRKIGVVFQYPEYQLFETTVEKDVAFGLKHLHLSTQEKTSRIRQSLETMGFSYEAIRSKSPLSLSGGEKRRVAVAGILAIRPEYLILDEPAAGLDPPARQNFLSIMQDLHRKGITILMITHDADIIAQYCERLLILEDGCLVRDDSPRRIFSEPESVRALHLDVSTPRRIAELLEQQGKIFPQDIIQYQDLRSALLSVTES